MSRASEREANIKNSRICFNSFHRGRDRLGAGSQILFSLIARRVPRWMRGRRYRPLPSKESGTIQIHTWAKRKAPSCSWSAMTSLSGTRERCALIWDCFGTSLLWMLCNVEKLIEADRATDLLDCRLHKWDTLQHVLPPSFSPEIATTQSLISKSFPWRRNRRLEHYRPSKLVMTWRTTKRDWSQG